MDKYRERDIEQNGHLSRERDFEQRERVTEYRPSSNPKYLFIKIVVARMILRLLLITFLINCAGSYDNLELIVILNVHNKFTSFACTGVSAYRY